MASLISPALIPTVSLGGLESILWRAFRVQDQWGVYDSTGKALGDPAAFTGLFGSVLDALGIGSTLSTDSVEFCKETAVSDFPVERGGFASYNKVEAPAAPTVKLCMQGSEDNRKTFLAAIDKACMSTDLFTVMTPEVTYKGYSIERYDYQRRASHGATLLTVSLYLKEVRQVSAQFTKAQTVNSPKDAGAAPQVDGGKVQAQEPETSTLRAGVNKLGKIFQ